MKFANKFGNLVVKGRYWFFAVFVISMLLSLLLVPMVNVNYDIVKYLPHDSITRNALLVMEAQYGASSSAQVMIQNVTKEDATAYSTQIASVEGVASIMFNADDEHMYKDGNALIYFFLDYTDYSKEVETVVNDIKILLADEEIAMNGNAINAISTRNAVANEMPIILLIAIAIVLGILLLTTRAWIEPLVFIICIGVAIIINMGTNVLLGNISFVTQSISSIMLLALGMDYSIVLLSRYREEREKCSDSKVAMKNAINGGFLSIASSGLTVIAGLVALMFMQFGIGFDIGLVLTKGVLIELLAILLFMPSLILIFDKVIEKTKHKSFVPKVNFLGSFAKKVRFVMPAIFMIIMVGVVCVQSMIPFSFETKNGSDGSQLSIDNTAIQRTFGVQNSVVVLVDKDSSYQEQMTWLQNIKDLEVNEQKHINNASSFVGVDQLFTILNKSQIATTFSLSNATIEDMLSNFNKDINVGTLYNYEILKYLHINKSTVSITENTVLENMISTSFQDSYTAMNRQLTRGQAVNLLGGNNLTMETIINGIYDNYALIDKTTEKASQVVRDISITVPDYQLYLQWFTPLNNTAMVTSLGGDANPTLVNVVYNLNNISTMTLNDFVNYIYTNKTNVATSCVALKMAQYEANFASAESVRSNFESNDYTRFILNLNLPIDSDEAKEYIITLDNYLATQNVPCYIVSNTLSQMEMEQVFASDKSKVDWITILAIIVIVLLAFRSLAVPLLLVLTIQTAIWCNLAINLVTGTELFFICYLLAMAIQMGATIDYGIFLTDRYIEARKTQDKFTAIKTGLNNSLVSIITSCLILVFASFTIGWVSTMPLISDIGLLIGRGALLSGITILLVYPAILLLCDPIIGKTTLHSNFYHSNEVVDAEAKTASKNISEVKTMNRENQKLNSDIETKDCKQKIKPPKVCDTNKNNKKPKISAKKEGKKS